MHIVGIAVIGRCASDNRLEGGWPHRADLQTVEASPRDTDHADIAIAPRLPSNPGNNLFSVVEFLLQVLVAKHSLRLPGSTKVDANADIAIPRNERLS